MIIPICQVDTFTSELFSGNPAAVCILDEWIDDKNLQAIAAENNLSETAFLVEGDSGFDIRWFTPLTEVALCGHATFASSFVIFNNGLVPLCSGTLLVKKVREKAIACPPDI